MRCQIFLFSLSLSLALFLLIDHLVDNDRVIEKYAIREIRPCFR